MTRPVALMGPHAAVMGIKFYTGKMFPAEYQNTAFVVRKGSWNREKPFGFDVVNVRVGEDGKVSIRAVRHRLPGRRRGLQVLGPPGLRRADARRRAARVRRAERRDLPHQLPEAEGAGEEIVLFALRKGRWALLLTALFASSAVRRSACSSAPPATGPTATRSTRRLPSIAGQPKLFIENQLILFREELRKSEQMLPVVKGLKDAEIIKLAEHFSKLPAKRHGAGRAGQGPDAEGRAKSQGRCAAASATYPTISGQNQIPRLAGQREAYLDAEMRAYRDGKRTGGDTIMAAALYGVGDADIKALAHYLSRSP